jgi:hypothetical protein
MPQGYTEIARVTTRPAEKNLDPAISPSNVNGIKFLTALEVGIETERRVGGGGERESGLIARRALGRVNLFSCALTISRAGPIYAPPRCAGDN